VILASHLALFDVIYFGASGLFVVALFVLWRRPDVLDLLPGRRPVKK
jgi:hypothetical protein